MNTIKYCTESEWIFTLREMERKSFESIADLIGKIKKYRCLANNSTGIQQQIYKKELIKLNKKLKERNL